MTQRRTFAWTFVLIVSVGLLAGGQKRQATDFDVLISGGRVVDGTGGPWYRADIGIRHGRIAEIGNLQNRTAKKIILAHDEVVAPGFIDMMAGSSLPLILDRVTAKSKLLEGVTTMLAGEGDSLAPQNAKTMRELQQREHFSFAWRTFGQYFRILEEKGVALNVIHNVGAAQVREVVIGDKDLTPTPAQMEQMKNLVAQAMRDGAVGISTALIYPPGSFATTDELIALAKVAARYHGIYLTHMRSEGGQLLQATREAIHIGEAAGLPVHIYHLKAAGKENWPLIKPELALIAQARRRGVDVTADVYPYLYNGIGLDSFINPRHFANGREAFVSTLSDPKVRAALRHEIETTTDWENWYQHVGRDWNNVLVEQVPPGVSPRYEGMSIQQIAAARGVDAWTEFFDLVQHGITSVNCKSMNEEQKDEILRSPFVSLCSDAPPTDPVEDPHANPRAFGTFPRVLAKYVREEKILSLEEAVREMTSAPADVLQLYDRGRIAPGMAADLVVFNPATVQDTATYARPDSYPVGIDDVLVNGTIAVEGGKYTGELAGRVLRHGSL